MSQRDGQPPPTRFFALLASGLGVGLAAFIAFVPSVREGQAQSFSPLVAVFPDLGAFICVPPAAASVGAGVLWRARVARVGLAIVMWTWTVVSGPYVGIYLPAALVSSAAAILPSPSAAER